MLSEPERQRIEAAVRRAEAGTAGEIVVVVARQAASYRSVPLLYGLAAALLAPWPLLLGTEMAAGRIFAVQLAVALLAMLATFGADARIALVPPAVRRARAREAAAREFAGRGLADTRGRTGVLLYVAEAERYAEVIGDRAIADRVDAGEWRRVIEGLVEGIGRGSLAAGLEAAVGQIGAILARHVPPGSDPSDELPNRVVLL